MPINYFELAIDPEADREELWEWLEGCNAKVDVTGTQTVNVLNVYLKIEYQPLKLVVPEKITARIQGVDDTGLGSGTLLENPADVINDMSTNFLGFSASDLDASSFATAKTATPIKQLAFVLRDPRDSQTLTAELAQQSRCYYRAEADKYKLSFKPAVLGASTRSIGPTGAGGRLPGTGKIKPLGLDRVYNRVIVRYGTNPEGDRLKYSVIAEDAVSQGKYGVREQIVDAWALPKKEYAQNVADALLATQKDPRYFYECETGLYHIDLERGAVIDVTDARCGLTAAKGEIVGKDFLPGSGDPDNVRPDRLRFTMLLDPVTWDWSESGETRWAPGEGGTAFSGTNYYVMF